MDMNNKKQSSIDWLISCITEDQMVKSKSLNEWLEIFEQAKAMHKEEMVNTWTEATAPTHEIGLSDTTYILAQIKKAEQYYNEHYEQ
jgi:hypothetical protein